MVGANDGDRVGIVVGTSDGACDGIAVGARLGTPDGFVVGATDGVGVGTSVGASVGGELGLAVGGSLMTNTVGLAVGESVASVDAPTTEKSETDDICPDSTMAMSLAAISVPLCEPPLKVTVALAVRTPSSC